MESERPEDKQNRDTDEDYKVALVLDKGDYSSKAAEVHQ